MQCAMCKGAMCVNGTDAQADSTKVSSLYQLSGCHFVSIEFFHLKEQYLSVIVRLKLVSRQVDTLGRFLAFGVVRKTTVCSILRICHLKVGFYRMKYGNYKYRNKAFGKFHVAVCDF